MKKQLLLLNKEKAISFLSKTKGNNKICYYLSYEEAYFIYLRDKFSNKIEINNLSGMFDETLQEIKEPYLGLMGQINKRFDSLEWWGSVIASKNSEATPLLKNIVYLFCAKRILNDSVNHMIFIVDSQALSECISKIAFDLGYQVINNRNRLKGYLNVSIIWLKRSIWIANFIVSALQNRFYAFKYLKPLTAKKTTHIKKRIVIRSWITKGNFGNHKRYKDRNFALLPDWLKSNNYEVWILPMFFNISISKKDLYSTIKDQKQNFLIPDHYLKISDYFRTLLSGLKIIRMRVENVKIFDVNLTPIFNENIKQSGFSTSLLLLNLCYQMLKRLQEKDFQIDGFYYAFECNSPEKQFILGCRKYFPNSKLYGYQHTTFFPNQLAYHFSKEEINFHPFPDKIICKGPMYIDLFKKVGLNPNILFAGPNLRFENVWDKRKDRNNYLSNEKKNIIIVLPSKAVANTMIFSFLEKIRKSIYNEEYTLYIRSHPDLPMSIINRYLKNVGIIQYTDASDYKIQYWLQSMYAGIIPGISITVLETAAMGVPVIQVIPENTIFYNPIHSKDYPLTPVRTDVEIKQQLETIKHHLKIDKNFYGKLSTDIKNAYFTKPNEGNLNIFL